MRTIPDSNVVLDIIQPPQRWTAWSLRKLRDCSNAGTLLINQIIYAEICRNFSSHSSLSGHLKQLGFEFEDQPWEAAFMAGQSHRAYRSAGGTRDRVLADFLIGAHAAHKGYSLLTRDQGRFRTYFPTVNIIAPDTHP